MTTPTITEWVDYVTVLSEQGCSLATEWSQRGSLYATQWAQQGQAALMELVPPEHAHHFSEGLPPWFLPLCTIIFTLNLYVPFGKKPNTNRSWIHYMMLPLGAILVKSTSVAVLLGQSPAWLFSKSLLPMFFAAWVVVNLGIVQAIINWAPIKFLLAIAHGINKGHHVVHVLMALSSIGATQPALFLVGVLVSVSGALYRNLVIRLENSNSASQPPNCIQKPDFLLWIAVLVSFLFLVLDADIVCKIASTLFAAKYCSSALPKFGTKKRSRKRIRGSKNNATAQIPATRTGPTSQKKNN